MEKNIAYYQQRQDVEDRISSYKQAMKEAYERQMKLAKQNLPGASLLMDEPEDQTKKYKFLKMTQLNINNVGGG